VRRKHAPNSSNAVRVVGVMGAQPRRIAQLRNPSFLISLVGIVGVNRGRSRLAAVVLESSGPADQKPERSSESLVRNFNELLANQTLQFKPRYVSAWAP